MKTGVSLRGERDMNGFGNFPTLIRKRRRGGCPYDVPSLADQTEHKRPLRVSKKVTEGGGAVPTSQADG